MRAPELVGRGWLNTAGPLTLRELRGRFVLLDFWTFCCVNCLHVLDELRDLEAAHAEDLVVVGVHSPKFVHEADPDALAAAVERHGVHHPVLDDPELVTWQAYTARAWPTLVLVDPEGYVVAQYAGEGHAHAIAALLDELVPEHRARGTLQPAGSPYVAPEPVAGDLRFPAKAVRLDDGSLLVADAGHDEVVAPRTRTARCSRRIGGFREPNGLCLLPPEVAAEVGYDVVVADTVGHRLAGLDTATGEVRTLAGDGHQGMPGDGTTRLSSPWDVAWWQDRVWVAMAGIHQLWTFDPRTGAVAVAGGTGHEGLLDGPLAEAWFAQTSGLAPDGDRLWVADPRDLRAATGSRTAWCTRRSAPACSTSASATAPPRRRCCSTRWASRVLPDGAVAVCDTYNGAVRRFDPATGQVSTLATDLAEPAARARRRRRAGGGRVGRPPADAAAAGCGRHPDRRLRPHHPRPVTEVGDEVELVVSFVAAARPGGRRAPRPGHPARRRGHPAGAAARGRRPRHRPAPPAGPRPARRRGRAARRRPRRHLRPGRRRGRGLPDAPAGLGHPGPPRRRWPRRPGAPARWGSWLTRPSPGRASGVGARGSTVTR